MNNLYYRISNFFHEHCSVQLKYEVNFYNRSMFTDLFHLSLNIPTKTARTVIIEKITEITINA